MSGPRTFPPRTPNTWDTFADYQNTVENVWLNPTQDSQGKYLWEYPYTAMGYTFDWLHTPTGPVDWEAETFAFMGMSEFEMQRDSLFYFDAFIPTLEYVLIPEPGTLILIVLGGGWLLVRRKFVQG